MITHNEVTALLWLLVAASSGTAGFGISRAWPSRKRLYAEYDRGYRLGADTGYAGGYDDGRYDERQARIEEVTPDGAEGFLPGRPGADISVRPAGSSPAAGRTIYPELAALAAESEPEPAPVLDPHWYARQMHELADWHLAAQADAAYFEQWLPGYLDWYRRSLESSWSTAGKMLEAI